MNIYYVYAYLRKSSNTPYYIGKGKDGRAYEQHRINGKGVHTPKDKSKIVFLERNLTNLGACAIERRMIRWYGRKDLNTGILHNRTDGGEGVHGRITSNETKQKISNSNKGRIVVVSEETKRKISETLKRRGNTLRLNYIASQVTKNKISAALKGIPKSEETKQKMRKPKGKHDILICPYCGKTGGAAGLTRYHFGNCKLKNM